MNNTKPFIKTVLYSATGAFLLFAGYTAGLVIQQRQDIRTDAYSRLFEEVRLHKQLSTGLYEQAIRDCEFRLRMSEPQTRWNLSLTNWPSLIKASTSESVDADWQDRAFASLAGLHHVRPEIAFAPETTQRMETFAPQTQSVRDAFSWYAEYKPVR